MKGTLAVTDALVSLLGNQVSVITFGTQAAYTQIQEENAAYNRVVQEELAMFTERSEDVTRAYGGAGIIDAEEMNEFDSVDASKVTGAYPVSFPLTRHGSKVGYTSDFLATNSVDQLAAQYLAARTGDQIKIQSKIRRALYVPVSRPVYLPGTRTVNPNAYIDRLVPPNVPLGIYPLLNADGAPVPVGPNGETFDGATHTHYMASDWTAPGSTPSTRDGDLQATCNNLLEHAVDGDLMIVINRAQEGAMRALPNFVRNFDSTVRVADTITYATGALDVRQTFNRCIGTFNGFEVWVKPWALPGKIVPMAMGGGVGGGKVLVWRVRKGGLWADFNFRAEGLAEGHQKNFPIGADPMTRDGDCSVWERHMAVVLDVSGPVYTVNAAAL